MIPDFDPGRVYRAHPLPENNAPFLVYVAKSHLMGNEGSRLYMVRKVREDRQHVKSSAAVKFSKDGSKDFVVNFYRLFRIFYEVNK